MEGYAGSTSYLAVRYYCHGMASISRRRRLLYGDTHIYVNHAAVITATPYFLSRLEGSPLKSTFSSYLSAAFMISNLPFLAHATATAKQVGRIRPQLSLP